MTCGSCGAPVTDAFCPRCGAPRSEDPGMPDWWGDEKTPVEPPVEAPPSHPRDQGVVPPSHLTGQGVPPPPQRRSKAPLIVALVLLPLLLLAVAAAVAVSVAQGGSSEPSTTWVTKTVTPSGE